MQISRFLGISICCGWLLACSVPALAATASCPAQHSFTFNPNGTTISRATTLLIEAIANMSVQAPPAHDLPAAKQAEDSGKQAMTPVTADRSLDPGKKRIYLFAILVLVTAILLKILLIIKHWMAGRASRLTVKQPAASPPLNFARRHIPGKTAADKDPLAHSLVETLHNKTRQQTTDEAPPTTITALEGPAYGQLIEEGQLADIQVPALFKRWAASQDPVQLVVTRAASEKRFYLCDGAIYCSLARNNRYDSDSEGRSQLLYMLTRDDLISARDRDRAIYQVENDQQPDIVSALLAMDVISEPVLSSTMERLAKISVFSLILFPEGEYRIFSAGAAPPAADRWFSLGVKELISEAARHRREWTAIRRALPNLGNQLIFSPQGRDKLSQVKLSIQQQLILTQIDGLSTVADLCETSVMIDYEIFRFLYMMLKAGVLELTKASS